MSARTKISATEAARNLSDILNRLRYAGEHFEIVRNGEVIANLDPAAATASTVGDLRELMRSLPPLDPEDAAEWQDQLRQIRTEAKMPPSPWD